jgi:phage portal protein BeeE
MVSSSACIERNDHAIERRTRAVLAQQAEKAAPLDRIGDGIAFLRGVAAGGVDQHGLVGKPPVAMQRAALRLEHHALRRIAHLARQGKLHPGVEQRRGFSRAGTAEDHVPGQFVQIALALEACGAIRRDRASP